MTKTALVLGPSGRFGRHAAAALAARGWRVRPFDRKRDTLDVAARGADVIVAGWHPPYPDWAAQVPQLHASIRAAAPTDGARVLLPGNVYVFGPQTPVPWSEESPHRATNPLGRIRIDMEAAYREDGVRTLLLRAGDFIDTAPSGNWFDRIIAAQVDKGRVVYPGRTDIDHAWAFLPDLAETAARLLDREATLPVFAAYSFPGHTLTGETLCAEMAETLGRPLTLKRFNWRPLRLAAPVWPLGRSIVEMRYLWDTPHSLDGARLDAVLPDRTQTPLRDVLAQALDHSGSRISTQTSR